MGSGKSYLIESLPRCLRINFDTRPCTSGNPLCDTWPYVDNGVPLDTNGNPLIISVENSIEVVSQLIAQATLPNRPYDTICYDTIDALFTLLKPLIAKRDFGADSITKVDARHSYPKIAEEIYYKFILPLRNVGYGIVFNSHVVSNTVFTDEKATGQVEDLRIPPSIRNAIVPSCDMICRLEGVEGIRKVDRPQKNPDGTILRVLKVDEKYKETLLYTKDPRLPNFLKIGYSSKFPNPLTLPSLHPWQFLEATYRAAYDATVAESLSK